MSKELKLLGDYHSYLRAKKDPAQLLLQERLLTTALLQSLDSGRPLSSDLVLEFEKFVRGVNLHIMENHPPFAASIGLLSRAIDLMVAKPFKALLPRSSLLELQITCFTNLATVYQDHRD
jgi:hypothetical protein